MYAQPTVQGTIYKTGTNSVTIYGKPNVSLNNALFEGINICISIPDHGVNNPSLSITNNYMPTLGWTRIGTGPSVENGRAYYTYIGNDNDVVAPMNWTAGSENPIIEFTFTGGVGQEIVRLDDLSPDGGQLFQSYWYVQANVLGDITNYDQMFYGVGAVNNSADSPSYVPSALTVSLPIEIISFTARLLNSTDVQLDWITANEMNSSDYDVERSINGKDWSNIGNLIAEGKSQKDQYYSYNDTKAFDQNKFIKATLYYRLKMVDLDGAFKYSEVRQVKLNRLDGLLIGEPFPNPAELKSAFVQIPVFVLEDNDIQIDIYDIQGKIVSSNASRLSSGNNKLIIEINNLSTGVFNIKLTLGNGVTTIQKLVIQ